MTFITALNVLKHQSLPTLVQEELERMIMDGRLLPGEQLREVALAALLGVSRGPIRESFRALEEKGLVSTIKNCGVFVRKLDPVEADQIYEVREALEALIGQKIVRSIDAEGISSLRTIVDQMAEAVTGADINRYTALNFSFHDALARLSGNPKLHATYQRLVAELSLFRRHTYIHDESSMTLSLAEHRAIFDAIVARQPRRVADLLHGHVSDSRRRLHHVLDPAKHSVDPS
jgi:phosphonate utilization transcriptional regulator